MICICKTHTLAVAGIGTTYLTCRVNLGKFPKAKLPDFTVNVPSLKYRFTLYSFLSAQLLNQLNVCLNSLCHYLCSLHCILQCVVFELPHPCYSMDVIFGVLYNIVCANARCLYSWQCNCPSWGFVHHCVNLLPKTLNLYAELTSFASCYLCRQWKSKCPLWGFVDHCASSTWSALE